MPGDAMESESPKSLGTLSRGFSTGSYGEEAAPRMGSGRRGGRNKRGTGAGDSTLGDSYASPSTQTSRSRRGGAGKNRRAGRGSGPPKENVRVSQYLKDLSFNIYIIRRVPAHCKPMQLSLCLAACHLLHHVPCSPRNTPIRLITMELLLQILWSVESISLLILILFYSAIFR